MIYMLSIKAFYRGVVVLKLSTTKSCKIRKDFSDSFIIEVLLKNNARKGTINKLF